MMKKLFISMIALLAMVACGNDEALDVSATLGDAPIITASFEGAMSRVSISEDEGAYTLAWEADDCLSVFMGEGNMKYTHQAEGVFAKEFGEQGVALSVNANYAVYPYNASTSISSAGVVTLTMPSEQSYVKNSFGAGANTMVSATATKEETDFIFKNVGGYLRLYLYGNNVTVKSVEFKGNNNESLAGEAAVTATASATPNFAWISTTSKSIILNCGEGVELGATAAEATEFWFVVPVTEFENGFTVTITDVDGDKMVKSTNKSFEVERNVVKTMDAVEVVVDSEFATPIIDVKFNADGTATNIGSMSELTVARVATSSGETPLMSTYTNAYYPHNNIAHFTHVTDKSPYSGGVVAHSYFSIDYSANQDFKDKLNDGYSIETVIMFEEDKTPSKEIKAIGSSESGGFCISVKTDGKRKLCFTTHDGKNRQVFDSDAIVLGKYYHVVTVYDTDTDKAYLYVDGTLKGSVVADGDKVKFPSSTNAQRLVIGADPTDNKKTVQAGWYGDIGMVRVYDESLSATDVAKRFEALTLPAN